MNTDDWLHLKPYGYAPGNYMARCHTCSKMMEFVDKRAVTCRQCAEQMHAAPIAQARCIRPHCPSNCSGCGHAIPSNNEALVLIADLLDAFANDGHGAPFEDGESALTDRARAYLCRATREPNAAQASTPVMDLDAAKRLRRVCNAVGLGNAVPADDARLWGVAFSVLGMVALKVEAAEPGHEVARPKETRHEESTQAPAPLNQPATVEELPEDLQQSVAERCAGILGGTRSKVTAILYAKHATGLPAKEAKRLVDQVERASAPQVVEPTQAMLDAFQQGFQNQLGIRHRARFKPEHQLTARERMSAEEAGLRAMLKAQASAPSVQVVPLTQQRALDALATLRKQHGSRPICCECFVPGQPGDGWMQPPDPPECCGSPDGDVNGLCDVIGAALAQAPAQPAAPNPWRDAVDAALVSAGLDCLAPDDADAPAAIRRLLEWNEAAVLDPAISERAQALIERGRAQPAAPQPAEPLSGETEAQRAEVCTAWNDLPAELAKHPDLQRLYLALGGIVQAPQPAAPQRPAAPTILTRAAWEALTGDGLDVPPDELLSALRIAREVTALAAQPAAPQPAVPQDFIEGIMLRAQATPDRRWNTKMVFDFIAEAYAAGWRAAQPAAEPGAAWRPIETAPREHGKLLLGWIWYVKYDENDEGLTERQCGTVDFIEWQDGGEHGEGYWMAMAGPWGDSADGITHWMPLPLSPETTPTPPSPSDAQEQQP